MRCFLLDVSFVPYLFSSIKVIPSMTDRMFEVIKLIVGGDRVIDLLLYIPHRVIDRSINKDFSNIEVGAVGSFIVEVVSYDFHNSTFKKAKKFPHKVNCILESGDSIILVFFNTSSGYIKKILPLNSKKIVSGKVSVFKNIMSIANPDRIVNFSNLSTYNYMIKEPVYRTSVGISSKKIWEYIKFAINMIPKLDEWLGKDFIEHYNLPSFNDALNIIHVPSKKFDKYDRNSALLRMACDESLYYQITLIRFKNCFLSSIEGRSIIGNGKILNEIIKLLPFELTKSQEDVIAEIISDQAKPFPMLRLLQGDVGSGKTIVALAAMINTIEAGGQCALMAPTAILADQHFKYISNIVKNTSIRVEILTGSTKKSYRKVILENLFLGEINILIGTHALFVEDVVFKDLSLIIIDEQHRFGVDQRNKLIKKGNSVDVLLMTATPIPRTLSQSIYGNILNSVLKEKPKKKANIITKIMHISSINELLNRLQESKKKAYWICPLIEDSENSNLMSVEKRYDILSKELGDYVQIMHGKMSDVQKDEAILKFRSSKSNVLLSTTVVEVGIDVPDATIIIIENAECFGLAQLHQLRGRVGRGTEESFCILLYNNLTEYSKERLKILRESEDGFYIAEKDLELRREGDIVGTKQSGMPNFMFLDIFNHREIIKETAKCAEEILNEDPELKSNKNKSINVLLNIYNKKKDEVMV